MLPQDMVKLGSHRNVMREIFEYGKLRAAEIGAEAVLDFSLGNPSVPPPPQINEAICALLNRQGDTIHAYTSAQGELSARTALAASLSRRFGGPYDPGDLYLTVGAAAALCCCFRGLACPDDEFVLLAPYFTEYRIFCEQNGGKVVVAPPDPVTFQPDLEALGRAVGPHTKAVVINTPNNPTGVVYTERSLRALAALLTDKEAEYGHPIYLICDEPYREIVFTGYEVSWVPDLYPNTLVCYSYSKSLSLPGERIGYVLVPPALDGHDEVYAAICGAGRALGYVNAPALFQQVAAQCDGLTADLTVYQRNRDLLYNGLTALGYICAEPGGTFYLFLRSPEPDAGAFCLRARAYDLLMPPADDFGCPGWCRLAFCTGTEKVERALDVFARLAEEYGLERPT